MNNQSKRLLTILLALFMILTSFPLNAFAVQTETNVRNEITDIRTVGDKQVINLGTVKGQSRSNLGFFSGASRFLGFTTQRAGSSSETVAQKVEISLDKMGLNLEEDQFDPSALTEVGSFDVKITFKELGGRAETRTMTFQVGETKKTETFYLPKDFGNGNVEAEIPKLKQNISLRVYNGAGGTTNFTLGQDMTYKFELTQIVHPVIDLKVVDPYGKELQENINQPLGLKLTLEEEHDFNLPANTKTFNIRTLTDFAGTDIEDLNSTGDNPTLSITTQLQDKKLTVGGKTYKLNKITYKAIGQEVEINGHKKKVGGYIEFTTQPKIIVPTPDDSGVLPKTPDGYKRLSFHAETSANANDGRFENGEKLKVIDVLEGTEFKDKDLLAEIAKVKNPTAYLNGSKDDSKKFLKWNPALPTDQTAGEVADTDYWPVYLADGGEITPGEKLPDGVFEVKVIKDDTIAADPLYGKSYGVFKGSKLRRDKFPDLEAEKGHQNPKWTTEADAPATGMVEIKKPWTKVIEKNTTFKATAAKDAATQIGKDGLKAVDTIALQGQELTEEFWHKGVALADNTPEDKKDAFAALLKDATVTDKSSRTTAEAGDKVGILLVTFKDGSTLEVPNQKLIVKPNTVEVSFDNEVGDDAKAPRHKETVVKGKVTSKSGYPVKGAVVEIKDEAGKVIGITQVIDDDGNFTAGTRELKAGEKLTASVTLPDSKLSADSKPKTVKLNADRLKDLLPIAQEQYKKFKAKENAFIKDKLEALNTAITTADPLIKDGKATATDTAENQTAINNAVKALEEALKALTANIPPTISGPKTHEIFVGQDLDLKKLVDVTDGDGADDLVVENGSNVKVEVKKVEGQTESPVADLSTIKDTVGTYKVTYTAKDKANAEVTHEMTLTVKERTNSAIEVTKDPSKMSYLITEKDGKAKLDLKGMTLNLVDNLGKKTKVELTDPKVKFKVNGRDVTNGSELTLKDDVKFIEVEYKDGDKTLTAKTDGVLRVGPDYDKDGTDDRTQDFDPEKIEKLEVIKQPQLDYIAKDKSEDDKVFKLNLEGMIVRMTDKAGKEKLAVVKNGKFVDYDDNNTEITVLTATPAHGAKLTPETSATETGDNGKTVAITGPNNSKAETEPLKVFYDANGDGTPDHNKGQKTPAPSAMARNIGKTPTVTTIEGMATPGAVIKITDKDGKVLTTEPEKVVAGKDGKYTATIKPLQADGTEIKVTAKLGEMAESDATPAKVFDDKNDNKQPDRDEGFNIEKATDIKFVDQPDLTYLVPTKETEVTFDGKNGKGKAIYLELSYKNGEKTESKIMTLEDLMKDTKNIAVTPANGTKDKIGNDPASLVGKAIEVKLKKVDPETATSKATSESTFAIEIDADGNGIADKDEKTPSPTAKALNVGKAPTTTTITGKAVAGAKVVAKVGEDVVGETTADQDGNYTIEAKKDGAALPVDTKVEVTAQVGEKQTSKPTEAIVKEDKDSNGTPDNEQGFDITKAAKIEMVSDPNKMDYLVTSKEGKVKFDATGMLVRVTDKAGKEKLYTAAELTDDTTNFTVAPAHNSDLTIDANHGKKVKVTLITAPADMQTKEVETTGNLSVKLDANNNGTPDDQEVFDIAKATKVEIIKNPDKMNYSVKEKTGKTPFDAKGVMIRLTDASGKTATYNYDDIMKAENKGKFTLSPADKAEIGLKEDGSVNAIPFTVTVTGAETKPSVTAKENITVILDKDDNGVDDRTENTPEPTVTARNIGTDGPDGKKVPATKTTVEIKTEPKAKVTIEYTDKDGQPKKIENLTAGENGNLTYDKITPALKAGTEIKVTVQDGEKKPATKTANVFDDLDADGQDDNKAGKTERPAALASNIGKNPEFTTITGEAEKGATVTAYVGTEVVGTATADKTTGKYTIEAKQNNAPIKQGVKIDVTATLAPKTESLKQTVVVFNDTDGTGQPDSAKDFDPKKATGMQVVASPDKMVYTDGDQLNLDGMKVLLTDVNGNQKIFTYKHDANTEFTEAGLSVDYKQNQKLTNADNDKKLTVTLDTTGNTQVTEAITGETPTALTVNKNQSAEPTDLAAANQGDAKVTKVKGKAVSGAEIKVTDKDGNNLLPDNTTVKADSNGDFIADLNKLLNPGTKVYFTATEPGKTESPKEEETVIRDKNGDWEADTGSKLSTPVIDPIREKDEKVVVEAPKADDKIQTIEVSDQNGNTVTLTKDGTGNTWTVVGSDPAVKVTEQGGKIAIPVKDKLPLNDRDHIKVTFKDGENPANEAFDKVVVQKASQKPTVDPVYTNDTDVKIVDPTLVDPTAKTIKVKVNKNDTMTIEKQDDGTWKNINKPNDEVKVEGGKVIVPLDPSAKKDDVIKVSTVNDSKVESPQEEVKVVDKVPTQKPTIKNANKDENFVTGTAAPNAEITITVTPKNGEPKTFTGKADASGKYKVTTDPLVDGDKVVAKASEPGKADNTSDPTTVGVKTGELQKSIEKAEEIGGENGKDLDEKKPIDKELKDALEKGKNVKAKGDAGDPDTDQDAVDNAKKELDKAIAQKEADTAVDKAKDNPTPENIKDAQDKIDAIPGSTDPNAEDYNPIKKELQDKLDLIKKIKEGEDRLKQDDVTGENDTPKKPKEDIDKLKKAIQDGKDALNKEEKDKYGEKTTEIEKAINILNQERINVSFKAVSFGDQTLFLRTSVPGARITVSINGKIITKSKVRNKEGKLIDVDYVTADPFGTYTLYFGNINEDGHDFTNGLSENDEIVVEATKDGYNPGEYTEIIY